MKFNFKIQQYQTDAVDAVVRVFNGQPHYDRVSYIRDLGRQKATQQTRFAVDEDDADLLSETGYKNEAIALTDGQLLDNIKAIQNENNIKVSDKLIGDVGRCSLDIEMETGTGKTYVYIKTMFELNKRYGWSKFMLKRALNAGLQRTWMQPMRFASMPSFREDFIFLPPLAITLQTGRLLSMKAPSSTSTSSPRPRVQWRV